MSAIRREAWAFARTMAVAVLTSVLIVVGLQVAFGGRSDQQLAAVRELRVFQQQTYHATLAEVCVLALAPDARRASLVHRCFTQYGLEPPIVLSEEDM